jgi:L-fuculose-phosphate aldolase
MAAIASDAIDLEQMREEVARKCREIAAEGVAVGGAGNVSVRAGEDRVLITRANVRFEQATADDITILTLDGEVVSGARPSSETGLHLGIYRRSEVGAVVHTHGQRSVAVGLVLDEIPMVHYNVLRLGGRIPTVPYFVFGSQDLADATGKAVAAGANAVLLRNHGSVACGANLETAIENSAMLEWICDVYIAARSLGEPALLTIDDLEDVLAQSQRLSYGDH